MTLSHFEQAVGHWRRPHTGPREARDHRSEIVSTIEAVLEFGEVTRHVLAADGPIGAGDRRLDVAESGVDPFEGGCARCGGSAPCDDDLMGTPCLGDATEAAQAVAEHSAVRFEAGFGEGGDRVVAETRHAPELEANRLAVIRGFDRRDEWGFALRAAAALASGAFTAEIGVVDLDATRQLLGCIPFEHDLRELVLELPRRGLGDAKAATEFDAGDPLLGLRHVIERAEPGAQRQLGRGEDSSGDRRGLQAAVAALKEVAGGHHAVPLAATPRALEALGPARRDNDRAALLFGSIAAIEFRFAEPFLELHHVARHWPTPCESAASERFDHN